MIVFLTILSNFIIAFQGAVFLRSSFHSSRGIPYLADLILFLYAQNINILLKSKLYKKAYISKAVLESLG